MNIDIYPTVLSSKTAALTFFNTNDSSKFLIVSWTGFVYEAFISKDQIKTKKIGTARFPIPCKEYYQSKSKNLIFGFVKRDFYVMDIENNVCKELVVSHDFDESILSCNMISENRKRILIGLHHTMFHWNDSYEYFLTYDFDENKVVDTSSRYQGGVLYYINENELLFQEWINNGPVNWWITNGEVKNLITTDFTKELTTKRVSTIVSSNVDLDHKKMFAVSHPVEPQCLCTVRWKEEFKDVSIVPFTFQEPKNRYVSEYAQFSADGQWVKTTSGIFDINEEQATFYHSDNKYPGGLSIPITGLKSTINKKGVWVQTQEHGQVYLESIGGNVYMYKMRDVAEQLIKKADQMVAD